MEAHDLAKLDRQLDELDGLLARLGDRARVEVAALKKPIHGPGWTSIAEVTLVAGVVESMIAQAKTLGALNEVLIKGANAVVVKK
jgi:hypothetical protein